jgi:hypothetical protein
MEFWKTLHIRFLDFIDSRAVVRRSVLACTIYLTISSTSEAFAFARVSTFDGLGTAAVIAAILTPLAALQGFAFSAYASGRKD